MNNAHRPPSRGKPSRSLHLSENVYKVDPLNYMSGRHIGLAWFSPDCKHFSKAKGGKPVERNIRDLCWIIPGWIERIQKSGGKVDVVIIENVEEFKDYGPLIEREFVTIVIDGESFVIVDIGMRMLTPRELYNAQGFPRGYVIDGVWTQPKGGGEPVWRQFAKSVQVSCVGNSVSPVMAEALVAANADHCRVERMAV